MVKSLLYRIIFFILFSLVFYGTGCGKEASKHISSPKFSVAGWLPTSWDGVRALETFMDNLDVIDEVSPVWYDLMEDGGLSSEPYGGPLGGAPDPWIVDKAHEYGIKVIPCIGNAFDHVRTSLMLNDPSLKSRHIKDILNEVLTNNYDGIDIDYENCDPNDRDIFSLFIEELTDVLHANEKLLSVCLHAKTESPGIKWLGTYAQDWERLGKVVDRFRIMTYDYRNSWSKPGPIAPISWVEEVIDFALTLIEPSKIFEGIPFYAYDWPEGERGLAISWLEVQEIISVFKPTILWNDEYYSPWFEYEKDSKHHEIWYENAESVEARVRIAVDKGIGGIAIWRIGSEDPQNWEIISRFKE